VVRRVPQRDRGWAARLHRDYAPPEKAGITASELQRFREPAPFVRPAAPVPQPAIDPAKPHLAYPENEYRRMVAMPDDVVTHLASVREPPVPA